MTATVKVDKILLKRVEKLINKEEKKIKFASKKQFVNVAVLELLEKEEDVGKKEKAGLEKEIHKYLSFID